MKPVPAYHTRLLPLLGSGHKPVYHIYDDCTDGNNIEPANRIDGIDGRELCSTCSTMLDLESRGLTEVPREGLLSSALRRG